MAMNESKLREAIRTAVKKIMKEDTMADNPAKYEEAEGEQKGAQTYPAGETSAARDEKNKNLDEASPSPIAEEEDDPKTEEEDVELEEGGRANRPENANQGEARRMTTSSAMREGKEKTVPLKEWYENNLYNKLVEQFARK